MSIRIQSNDNIYSNIFSKAYPKSNSAQKDFTDEEYSLRKTEYSQRLQEKNKGSVVDQALSYASQLKASRTKTKETSLEKKKLQYNFKKISSQIIRSKNSISARKAVQAAKREIMRLKRMKGSGEYDDEEVQLAIDHAKAMEKVAKKKVVHLEQEEMVERAHKGYGAAMEEVRESKEDTSSEKSDDEETVEDLEAAAARQELDLDEEYDAYPEYDSQGIIYNSAEYEQMMQELSAEMSENAENIAAASSDSLSALMDEFSEDMAEMLEDFDLTELSESLYAPDPNMSEDDLKLLKIKHRGKELKEIAEADKEYLKNLIEHEKSKASSSGASSGAASGAPSSAPNVTNDGAPKLTPVISIPGAAAGGTMIAPTISSGFSVSV